MIVQTMPYPAIAAGGGSTGSGPIPAFRAAGNLDGINAGSTSMNVSLPVGVAENDILLLMTETNPASGTGVPTPTGYTEVSGSPWTTGTTTQLGLFWKRAGSSEAPPSVGRPSGGDHLIAQILAFSGCVTTGDPVNQVAGGSNAGGSTSVTIPGFTTTINNCLIVDCIAQGDDFTSTASFSAWANASLASPSITEIVDNTRTTADGGGLGSANGGKATAGTVNSTTLTKSNTTPRAFAKIALLGP